MHHFFCVFHICFILLFIPDKTWSQTAQVDSLSQHVIGSISIEGNIRTRNSIILREMMLQTGDTLSTEELQKQIELDQQKIFNTNLFISVDITPNIDSTGTSLQVVVKERWYLIALPVFELADRNFNEWWYDRKRDLKRTIYGVYVSYGNVTGRGDKLKLLAEFGFLPKFEIAYARPYIDKAQKTGITTGISYSVSKNLAFQTWNDKLDFLQSEARNRERFYTYINLTRRNQFYAYHSVDLRWSHTEISDSITVLNPDYLKDQKSLQKYFQLTYTYSYDRRDHVQYPLKGIAMSFQISKLGLLPSDDLNLLYFYGSFRKYTPLGNRFYTNSNFRFRVSAPNRQPYLQTIGLGYKNDLVRGYELYVVDGQHYGLTKNELKYQLFSTKKYFSWIPVRQFNTIPIAAYLNTFADAGYVWNKYPERSNTQLGNTLLVGAGVGVDVVTFYNIVATLNLTFNKDQQKRVFFSITRDF
jgi:outer membrane protein assembly factor BamA